MNIPLEDIEIQSYQSNDVPRMIYATFIHIPTGIYVQGRGTNVKELKTVLMVDLNNAVDGMSSNICECGNTKSTDTTCCTECLDKYRAANMRKNRSRSSCATR